MKTLFAASVLWGLLSLSAISHAQVGKWVEKKPMPTARYAMSAAVVS
ncbi:hypothetical protein HYR99_31785 [Candidatus Poribacteria bacterium]|nr:hypothetical protein [Candidatus Poribacteria bacterium]